MDPLAEGLEFMDWSSMDEAERSQLHDILFGADNSVMSMDTEEEEELHPPLTPEQQHVVWTEESHGVDAVGVEQQTPEWEQPPPHQEYGEIPEGPGLLPARAAVPIFQAIVPPPVPVAPGAVLPPPQQLAAAAPPPQQATVNAGMYPLMMPPPQGVITVGTVGNVNLSVNANVHHTHSYVNTGYQQQQQQPQNHHHHHHQMYDKDNDRRQRGPKINKQKSRDYNKMNDEPTNINQYPQFVYPQHFGYIPHHTAAQPLTGSPLYIGYNPHTGAHTIPHYYQAPHPHMYIPMTHHQMSAPQDPHHQQHQQQHAPVEAMQQQQQPQQMIENQHNEYPIQNAVSPQPPVVVEPIHQQQQQIEEFKIQQQQQEIEKPPPIQQETILNENNNKIEIVNTNEIQKQNLVNNLPPTSEVTVAQIQQQQQQKITPPKPKVEITTRFKMDEVKSALPAPFKKPQPSPQQQPQSQPQHQQPQVQQNETPVNYQTSNERPKVVNIVFKNQAPVQQQQQQPQITPVPQEQVPVAEVQTETVVIPPPQPVVSTQQVLPVNQQSVAPTPPATPTVVAATPPPKKSWASIVQSSTPPMPVQNEAQNQPNKPLARVNPFSPTSPANAVTDSINPLAKTKAQMTEQDHLMDDPQLYRLGEYLCKYQLDHRSSALQPRGLTNRSNWCYVNATLQALLACPPFFNLMRSLPTKTRNYKQQSKSPTPIIDAVVEFMQEFSILPPNSRPARKEKAAVRKGEEGAFLDVPQGVPFEPSCVYNMLASIRSAAFKVEGRQEDAEEFLSCLLNALNDEMLELMKLVEEPQDAPLINGQAEQGNRVTNGDSNHVMSEEEDDQQWSVIRSKNRACVSRRSDFGRSPVSDIFRGQLCSHVQRKGEQQSENVQPFYTLQLDIEKARSVSEALDQMVDRDWLEGVTCSRTHQQVEAWQQVTLEELPPVLLLHLKWFDYKPDGCSKIMKNMDYTVDLRIENKLLSNSKSKYTQKQRIYKLFAVVYHDGQEASKGHYITDAYHSAMGVWVRYDDSQVRVVPEHVVTHPHLPSVPYILYYRRSDTMGLPLVKIPNINH